MGEIADQQLDDLFSSGMPFAGRAFPTRDWGWTMQDGGYIRIKDAETRHLVNMAKKLERDGRAMMVDIYYPILAEIQRRKNAAEIKL